ncbi:hypothetical protein BP00DRAFT_200887 [Aspergillus indologenus CBS 114.80]|uniref:Uncharacterized protein n=1 Tax=Aspergillus indologenus CBS 114.80 TaxID=1450541 RepID=A0A2V5I6B7_9EURO|nr:hypothetical protein BP00DRAFT_200887 [Aspergillus indologenus CBS 114.80]
MGNQKKVETAWPPYIHADSRCIGAWSSLPAELAGTTPHNSSCFPEIPTGVNLIDLLSATIAMIIATIIVMQTPILPLVRS